MEWLIKILENIKDNSASENLILLVCTILLIITLSILAYSIRKAKIESLLVMHNHDRKKLEEIAAKLDDIKERLDEQAF